MLLKQAEVQRFARGEMQETYRTGGGKGST